MTSTQPLGTLGSVWCPLFQAQCDRYDQQNHQNLELTRTLEKTLEDKLAYSDNAIIDNTILNNEIDKLEKQLEQIYEQKAKAAQIRSRVKWVEYGEKNNAYFLGLEKK